jgi:Arc/MetJ-type ribon-helix-helix transcriptional regulator
MSLPDDLKSFVDQQVGERGYGTSSEYVRELIRKDQDRPRQPAIPTLKACEIRRATAPRLALAGEGQGRRCA